MQYAAIEIKGKRILIDANELQSLHKYGDKIKDIPYNEDDFEYKVVYGLYLQQTGKDRKTALQEMTSAKDFAFAYINDQDCRVSKMCDIEPLISKDNGRIPFAALIKTTENITSSKKQALSFFLRYYDLTPATNILNRPGIFAVKDQERRIKESLTEQNWKKFIDHERLLRCANNVF